MKSKYSLLQNGSVKKEPTTLLSVDRLCILWLEDIQITVKQSTYVHSSSELKKSHMEKLALCS